MSNGCGCEKGLLKYVKPPYSKMFYVACCMHDDDYDRGGGKAKRKEADRALFWHIVEIAAKKCKNPFKFTWLVLIALLYYASVRIFGRYYFNYC